jgi:molybdopterin molybdotransferase
MIDVKTARDLIQKHTQALPAVRRALNESLGFILAEDVVAPIHTPPFDQSAMDGYAFCFADWQEGKALRVAGIVAAGDSGESALVHGTACRIFTGAPVPRGADTVVMQEKVALSEDGILILDQEIQKAANVRPLGSETNKGDVAMYRHSQLTPAAIGYLANLGITEILVFAHPRISIIITGKELNQPGDLLLPGKVYESNSFSLSAAVQQQQLDRPSVLFVDDDKDATKLIIEKALRECDLLLLTGGISVGDFDFVGESLLACGVEQVFHKIKQKPGKPLYFGKKGHLPVFALPGNPAAVLTCFYEYVLPCIKLLMGNKNAALTLYLPLLKAYHKKKGLTHFLKGRVEGRGVLPLSAQESYKLNSFSLANSIIELDGEKEDFKEGELVKVNMIWI